MTPHTPGPWAIKRVNYGAYHVGPVVLERPTKEAIDYAAKSGVDLLARRLANAYLVAAAPNMLAALKYVLVCIERGDPEDPQLIRDAAAQLIRDAAALAEGYAP